MHADAGANAKPIGWTIDDDGWAFWTQAVREHVTETWTIDSDFQDTTQRLQSIAHMGHGCKATARGVSATGSNLNAAVESTIDNDDERQRLQHLKSKNRDLIRREKNSSQWRHVLRNLRAGGWGKKAMGKTCST